MRNTVLNATGCCGWAGFSTRRRPQPSSKGARVNNTMDPLRTVGRITNSFTPTQCSSSLENITAGSGSMAQMGYANVVGSGQTIALSAYIYTTLPVKETLAIVKAYADDGTPGRGASGAGGATSCP